MTMRNVHTRIHLFYGGLSFFLVLENVFRGDLEHLLKTANKSQVADMTLLKIAQGVSM